MIAAHYSPRANNFGTDVFDIVTNLALHEHTVGFDDANFFPGNMCVCWPGKLGVIQLHIGEHCHIAFHHVGGIPATKQTHLNDSNVDRTVGKPPEGHGSNDFEVTQPCFN